MKKLNIALIVVTLVALTATTASADMTYDFEDMIDTWTVTVLGAPVEVDARPIVEGYPFSYQHDIRDDVDFAAGHKVTEAWLELDFTNDETDAVGSQWTILGTVRWDWREYARIGFDGTSLVDITSAPDEDVDDGQYQLVMDIDWLNDDGLLDVTIDVYNNFEGLLGGTATAYLDHSRLYGTAVTPVPGAALLGVLGLSAAGMKLRRRKSA